MKHLHAFACSVSERTVTPFADTFMLLSLVVLSIGSLAFALIAQTELAMTLFLSILALAITSAILYVGERREREASGRDEPMHAKLDSLLRGSRTWTSGWQAASEGGRSSIATPLSTPARGRSTGGKKADQP